MKVMAIGDIHAKAWPVFPTGQDGTNGYLKLVQLFFQDVVTQAKAQNFGKDDLIIFLGDVAEEPYKKGTISIDTQNILIEGFTFLSRNAPCPVIVIRGNHDSVTCATKQGNTTSSWLPALEPITGVDIVSAQPETFGRNGSVLCLPYGHPAQVEEWLQAEVRPHHTFIAGHFVPRGARVSETINYNDHDAVDISGCPCNFYVLGHAHVPQVMLGASVAHMVGTPLPYSWADKHVGQVHTFETQTTNIWKKTVSWFPQALSFVGPLTLEELRNTSSGLRAGSFARLLLNVNDKTSLQAARSEFPSLRISPVLDTTNQTRSQDPARLAALAQCLDISAPDVATGALKEYINHHKDTTAQGLDLKALLATGQRLVGVTAKAEEEKNDTVQAA